MSGEGEPRVSPLRRAIEAYGRAVDRLDRATMTICALLLVAVVALSAVEVVARTFFAASSVELVDLSLQLAILCYFVGYLVLLNRDEDIAIDYFYRRMPVSARRLVDLLTALAIAGLFLLLLVKSFALFRLGLRYNHPVFPIPNAITTLPAVIGALGGFVVAVRKALDVVVGKHADEPRKPAMLD